MNNDELREKRLFYLLNTYKAKLNELGLRFKFNDDKSSVLIHTSGGGIYLLNLNGIYDYESKKEVITRKDVNSLLLMIYSLRNIKNLKINNTEREILIKFLVLAWDLRRKLKK